MAANEEVCVGIPQNFSVEEVAYIALYSPFEKVFTSIITPIIAIIGIFSNLTFLLLVARVPRLRAMPINYYLVCLALADSTLLISAFVFFLWPYLSSEVSFAFPFNCWFLFWAVFIASLTSTALITVISIERYLAVCRPWQHRVFTAKKRTSGIIVAVIVFGITFGTLSTTAFGNRLTLCVLWPETDLYEKIEATVNTCGAFAFALKFPFMLVIFNGVPFYIAVVLNIVLYWKIIKRLSERIDSTSSSEEKNTEVRDQVARMLVVNGCVYFICQLPARISDLADGISAGTGKPWITPEANEIFFIFLRLAFVINSSINPFIYGLMSRHYRQGIRETFCMPLTRISSIRRTANAEDQTKESSSNVVKKDFQSSATALTTV